MKLFLASNIGGTKKEKRKKYIIGDEKAIMIILNKSSIINTTIAFHIIKKRG